MYFCTTTAAVAATYAFSLLLKTLLLRELLISMMNIGEVGDASSFEEESLKYRKK